jgi:hypothetical protein
MRPYQQRPPIPAEQGGDQAHFGSGQSVFRRGFDRCVGDFTESFDCREFVIYELLNSSLRDLSQRSGFEATRKSTIENISWHPFRREMTLSAMLDLTTFSQEGNSSWVRMPKPKGRLMGLSRTTILELIQKGAVKSVVIRKRHALRGIRLVFLPSLLEHLDRLHEEQHDSKCIT